VGCVAVCSECSSVLQQCVAVCCSVLQQCVAVCCSVLQCVQYIPTLDPVMMAFEAGKVWGVLQYVAVCCSVLQQYVAVCCSRVLQSRAHSRVTLVNHVNTACHAYK